MSSNVLGYVYVTCKTIDDHCLETLLIKKSVAIRCKTENVYKIPDYNNRTTTKHAAIVSYVDRKEKIFHAKVVNFGSSRPYKNMNEKYE